MFAKVVAVFPVAMKMKTTLTLLLIVFYSVMTICLRRNEGFYIDG